jgi:hypothetical protein
MRRLTISLFVVALATTLSAQDLDKILQDHFKASAQDKKTQITSDVTNGKVIAMGMETLVTMYRSRPSKLRIEADLMGNKMIQTYNGSRGWFYAPTMGAIQPREIGSADLQNLVMQADIDSPLWDFEARGNKLEQAGESEDGSEYKVKLTTSGGEEMTIFINKESSLISKILSTQLANGLESPMEMVFKNYKDVEGIPTAHYMAIKMGGQLMSVMTVGKVEYNKDLDPALFEKPVVQ